MHMQPTRTICP